MKNPHSVTWVGAAIFPHSAIASGGTEKPTGLCSLPTPKNKMAKELSGQKIKAAKV
jgi:hypothetical protein